MASGDTLGSSLSTPLPSCAPMKEPRICRTKARCHRPVAGERRCPPSYFRACSATSREACWNGQGVSTGIHEYGSVDAHQGTSGFEPRLDAVHHRSVEQRGRPASIGTSKSVHLASFSSIGLPTDAWIPRKEREAPRRYQYAIGYFRDLWDRKYEEPGGVYWATCSTVD